MPVIPLSTDSPLRRTPYANWGIIAANIVVFALCAVFRKPAADLHLELSSRGPHLYQFITYQFIHGGLLHIAGNMLFLYIFGNHINDKMGHLAYIAFYLAGGVFAGLFFVVTEGAGHPIIGASGAIAAVTGAYLVLLPQSTVTVVYWFFFAGRMEVQSLYLIVFFFAQDIFLNLGQEDSVAHMAHIGGTVFGATLCMALLAVHLLPRSQFDLWAFAQRWNRRRQYRDLVAKGYDPFNPAKAGRVSAGGPPAPPTEASELRQQVNAAIGMGQLPVAARLYSRLLAIDPTQVLSRQSQLDVATQLKHDGDFAGAAAAFDRLLVSYPKSDHNGEIELLVGILYARDVHDPIKARTHLLRAIDKIHDEAKAGFARQALEELGPAPASRV